MQIFRKKSMIAASTGMLVLLLCAILFLCVGDHSEREPRMVFAGVFFVLLSSIGFLGAALRESLKLTLYAYKNIGLIGGLIFLSVMAISLLGSYFSCTRSGEFTLSKMYLEVIEFPREFSIYALVVIIAVSLAVGVSNVVLIRREGLSRNNILSIVLAGFYCVATVVIYLLADITKKYIFANRGSAAPIVVVLNAVVPMFLMLLLCYFECIFAGTLIMGWKTAHTKAAYDKDYIIVLGCSIDKKGGLLPLLRGRVNAAIRFAWEQEIASGRQAKYVPSGGQGPNEVMSEGSAMGLYLMTRGAEDYEVFPEKRSVNTLENMQFSKAIIDDLKPDANIAFATTNYHILRSGILAREAGFDAEGIAGDTKWYFWPNGFVREFFGILSLKRKTHIVVAAVLALLCAVLGAVGYFGKFI